VAVDVGRVGVHRRGRARVDVGAVVTAEETIDEIEKVLVKAQAVPRMPVSTGGDTAVRHAAGPLGEIDRLIRKFRIYGDKRK
jgi:hypothetical protein